MASIAAIQSDGDLEVVLLHESHSVLAEIIGPELYSVGGAAPEQSVVFHTRSSFNLFLILLRLLPLRRAVAEKFGKLAPFSDYLLWAPET